MFAKYIVRFDDACPTMDTKKWDFIEDLCDRYDIKPIVAVIPNNKDKQLIIEKPDNLFWQKVKKWQEKGWCIALHGYDHIYVSDTFGLVPINDRSEFAGVEYEIQVDKIKKGIEIFKGYGIDCNTWVAPAHSFDKNTLKALKKETDIEIISDGIAFSPFYDLNFYWVPQQVWHFRKMFFGTWTGCFHPNNMSEKEFENLDLFIQRNNKSFVDIASLKLSKRKKNIFEKLFEVVYWNMMNKKKDRNVD